MSLPSGLNFACIFCVFFSSTLCCSTLGPHNHHHNDYHHHLIKRLHYLTAPLHFILTVEPILCRGAGIAGDGQKTAHNLNCPRAQCTGAKIQKTTATTATEITYMPSVCAQCQSSASVTESFCSLKRLAQFKARLRTDVLRFPLQQIVRCWLYEDHRKQSAMYVMLFTKIRVFFMHLQSVSLSVADDRQRRLQEIGDKFVLIFNKNLWAAIFLPVIPAISVQSSSVHSESALNVNAHQ